jgi:hypothetical protein
MSHRTTSLFYAIFGVVLINICFAQNLSFSSGIKYGLNITGKLSNRETNSYNFVRFNDVANFDAGIYFDTRYRFHKRRNWHVSVFGELSRMRYSLRMIDIKLSYQEHEPIRMHSNRFSFGFGIHKYFSLYNEKMFLELGAQFQFRRYFNAEQQHGDYDGYNSSQPFSLNTLLLDYKVNTKTYSFDFAPELYVGLKFPIDQKTKLNLGAQLSFYHFVEYDYSFLFTYRTLDSTTAGYGTNKWNQISAFSFLYSNIGLTRNIGLLKKNSNKSKLR